MFEINLTLDTGPLVLPSVDPSGMLSPDNCWSWHQPLERRVDTGILHSHPTHYFTLYKYLQLTIINANWPDIPNPELKPNTGCTRLGKRWYFDTLTSSALVWCSGQCSAPVALTRRRCITAQGVRRLKLLNTALAAIHSNFPNDPPVLQIVLSVPWS